MSLEELLECAHLAAEAGARQLESRFRGELEITTKSSVADYVTDADLASETAVRATLARLRPTDSITGEEFEAKLQAGAKYRWSIDPLDGTVNFARGLSHFCTSVAAQDLETGNWVVGAIIAPALGDTYLAWRGGGAWLIRSGVRTQIFGPPADRVARILATGFSYSAEKRAEEFEALAQMMPDFVDMRRLGSAALDICLVAEGSIDAYYQTDTKEHDWAAAMLIAEEAGLQVKRPTAEDDLAWASRTPFGG